MAYKKTKWREVYSILKKRIIDGTYPPGSEFPTNKEIGEEFDLHTVSVQQAVSELIREGLVNPAPSRARRRTVRQKIRHRSKRRGGFTHDSKNLNSRKEIIEVKIIKNQEELPQDVAKVMKTPVLYYHHNQYIDDILVANSQSYIPSSLDLEKLANRLNEKSSLYKTMEALGEKPKMVEESLIAKISEPEDSELLGLPRDSKIPVVKITRKVFDEKENLIEFCRLTDRGDFYVFEYRFQH